MMGSQSIIPFSSVRAITIGNSLDESILEMVRQVARAVQVRYGDVDDVAHIFCWRGGKNNSVSLPALHHYDDGVDSVFVGFYQDVVFEVMKRIPSWVLWSIICVQCFVVGYVVGEMFGAEKERERIRKMFDGLKMQSWEELHEK
jgi:hypothetical protein